MQFYIKMISLSSAILVIALIALSSGNRDIDADGIVDTMDNCHEIANSNQEDFDGDTFGDVCDDDDDNDKIIDVLDAFDVNKTEWADFDFDGLGANQDNDDDNDGLTDDEDPNPVLASRKLAEKNLPRIEKCANIGTGTPKLLCYSQLFNDFVIEEENNIDALELAASLTKLGAVDDCHFVSHEIGHAAYKKNPNVSYNLKDIDGTICRGGFYHGIMAAYFHDLKENENDLDSYKTICNDFIGSPEYKNCVHGIGHGLVHYFVDDLNSAINACDQMSFYQSSICVGGVFMQYTDNELVKSDSIEQDIEHICSKSELRIFDYQQCRDSLGLSIAFHTDHNLEDGSKICDLIPDDMGRQYCHRGLEREINDAKEFKIYDPTKGVRELIQPIWVKSNDSNKWIVDFRSPAIISDFVYNEESKSILFSFDKPYRIIMYISTDLLPENPIVTVNGQIQRDVEIKHGLYDNHSMIQIMPNNIGFILIS